MKRIVVAFLLLVLPLSGGCLGGVPLDRYCYVLDLGVERGDSMPYRFVFLLNEDTAGSGEDGENRGEVSMVCAEERSLFAAIDALSGALPAQLSFERTTLLAFSRELAEAGEMEAVMAGALSRLKIRQNVRVIVVEEDMRRAFQGLVSEGESRVREAFSNDTGDALLPYAGLVGGPLQPDMVGGQVYPYLGGGLLGEGQIKTSLCGSAVFAGDRMAGVLSGQHTMLVLMAKGTFQTGHLRLPWKGTELDMALYVVGKPKRSWQAGTFTCEITLEADLEHPAQVEADSEELIAAAESYLEEELEQVFRATAAAGADVFSVGRDAICTFYSWDSWRAYGFARRLQEVEPVFRVKVKLSHSPKDPALE